MISFYINLPSDIAGALVKLARLEERTPRDQVVFVLKKELQWRGLLPSSTTPPAQESAPAREI